MPDAAPASAEESLPQVASAATPTTEVPEDGIATTAAADGAETETAAGAGVTAGEADAADAPEVQSPLNKRQLARFRALLEERRLEIIGSVTSIEHNALTGGFSGASPRSGQHAPEAGQEHYEREFLLQLASSERELLAEIDAAILRIEEGTYGICEEMDQPIGIPRLEAKPWARLCIEAARRRDNPGGFRGGRR